MAEISILPLKVDPSATSASSVLLAGPLPSAYTSTPQSAVTDELAQLNTLCQMFNQNPGKGFPPNAQPGPNPLSVQINKAKEEGNTYFKKQQYPEAIKLYSLSIDLAASRPVIESNIYARDEMTIALANRSAAYAGAGQWENALADAQAATELKKQWIKGWFRQGKALIGLGRLQEAREAFLAGLQYDPNAQDLAAAVAEVEALLLAKTSKP